MLDQIRFMGFDLEGSSLFINENDNSDGGKYSLKFSGHHVVPQKMKMETGYLLMLHLL